MLYRVRTLTSHNAEESENSPESPHFGEIKRMRKQCVPGASPFFARAGDEANKLVDEFNYCKWRCTDAKCISYCDEEHCC